MIYIALLRGINVGGKNKVKMADLKQTLELMGGLSRVQTYIQSGNVLFEANEEEEPLRERIEHRLEAAFGFSITVVLRTFDELKRIAAHCPFSDEEVAEAEAASDAESLYVSFLLEEPLPEKAERLKGYQSENDMYHIVGREIYLLFRYSVRDSKLATNLHKLDVPATIRNWKTVNKLLALGTAMEA
ncbi:DUF1697 domain-containing protein [Paenibacillus sp. UNC451MF]|uniref:DUF1697 domain-containing protein n=1 Tax=Paenibacillus sp. UNC451MF TaxID=1449063 RepID=UPI00055E5DD2|nr:DUF1697 domain-containing protein [Paenibacillus sp. UNC451MF]